MLHQINTSLNQKTSIFLQELDKFSKSPKLDNDKPNPFFQVVVFSTRNQFIMGDKEYIIRFDNNLNTQYSLVELFRLYPTIENVKGYREEKLSSLNLKVGVNGDYLIQDRKILSHFLGIEFFNHLFNFTYQ